MNLNQVGFDGLMVDWAVFNCPQPAAGTGALQRITGWAWWVCLAVRYNLDNTLAAGPATAAVSILSTSTTLVSALGASAVAAGSQTVQDFAFNAAVNAVDTIENLAPLPNVPVAGDGTVQVSFIRGDGLTQVGVSIITIVGQKHRNKSQ